MLVWDRRGLEKERSGLVDGEPIWIISLIFEVDSCRGCPNEGLVD